MYEYCQETNITPYIISDICNTKVKDGWKPILMTVDRGAYTILFERTKPLTPEEVEHMKNYAHEHRERERQKFRDFRAKQLEAERLGKEEKDNRLEMDKFTEH